jgi:hypothetical protein
VCAARTSHGKRDPKMMIREMGRAAIAAAAVFSFFYLFVRRFSFVAYCSREFDSFVYY